MIASARRPRADSCLPISHETLETRARVRARAFLNSTGNPSGNAQFGAIQTLAPSLGIEVSPINMRDASEIERAAAAAVIRAQPRPPRDAVHKMATELENYGPPASRAGCVPFAQHSPEKDQRCK
jgi:hypothetical protein